MAQVGCAMLLFICTIKLLFNSKKQKMDTKLKKEDKNKLVTIIVNGTQQEEEKNEITYDEVVALAFSDFPQHPERTYSVTYERGHGNKPTGILSPGGEVRVKEGMTFKVKHTGQS